MLYNAFVKDGFDTSKSALVGYPLNGRIQLLSGTHRHTAAKMAGIKLPVTLWLRSDVEKTWGTELWPKTTEDIPVKELKEFEIQEGFRDILHEAINPATMYSDL